MAYVPPTIAALKATIKQRLDMEVSEYIDDTDPGEMDDMIRGSQLELWELLTSLDAVPLVSAARTTTAGVAAVSPVFVVATDGYNAHRILRVGLTLPDGDEVPLQQANLRNDIIPGSAQRWSAANLPKYLLHRAETDVERAWVCSFYPVPDAAYTVTFYGSVEPAYTSSPDAGLPEIDTLGYDEYIILDVIIKVRVKQEADASQPMMQKEAYRQRIVSECTPFDLASNITMTDRRSVDSGARDDFGWWRR